MHIVTYRAHRRYGQEARVGLWFKDRDTILDIKDVEKRALGTDTLPLTLRGIIEAQEQMLPLLHHMYDKTKTGGNDEEELPAHAVRLLAPYTDPPRNILCIGINYSEHLKELDRPLLAEQKLPETPFVFTKPRTAIAHPDSAVDGHAAETLSYDYEVELAVIIGKAGKNIFRKDAMEHVFGYSIMNDMSARDLQRVTTQWYRGKCLDESAPFGPCIATKDSIPDPQNLSIRCRINGEMRQDSHTSHMLFDVATIISVVSIGSTLLPGDIISTGTPAGVGMSFSPPRFLKPGDAMELEIEGIGTLRNHIR